MQFVSRPFTSINAIKLQFVPRPVSSSKYDGTRNSIVILCRRVFDLMSFFSLARAPSGLRKREGNRAAYDENVNRSCGCARITLEYNNNMYTIRTLRFIVVLLQYGARACGMDLCIIIL